MKRVLAAAVLAAILGAAITPAPCFAFGAIPMLPNYEDDAI